jgi:hypothetical protein
VQALFHSMPTLAIAALYCLWHHHEKRQRVLCKRVAYMLWVMANQMN